MSISERIKRGCSASVRMNREPEVDTGEGGPSHPRFPFRMNPPGTFLRTPVLQLDDKPHASPVNPIYGYSEA
jgi:hypothetical protein